MTLAKELRVALRAVAEPVRSDAERLAVASIPTVGVPWSRMRIGVTRTSIYVAPRQRGRNANRLLRRPKFADLLLDRAMEPALAANEGRVVAAVEHVLGTVGRAWEAV